MGMTDLTEPLRAALERVPDEWGPWPLGDWLANATLKNAGLVQASVYGVWVRRTPAGRAALEVKP